MLRTKKKNARFGRYPSCDLLNSALRYLVDDNKEGAFREIVNAIIKAGGYFYDDVAEEIKFRFGVKE